METTIVKGFSDYLGEEARKRAKIKSIIEKYFLLYGFEPAETPSIEYEEFVKGENANDEVISDIFKLEDKAGRKLALKYESTFQLKRIAKNQKLPYKRYEIARVFRNEPVKQGRFREFTQCDADIIGSNLKYEAEFFKMLKDILNELKIKSEIYVNNRKLLNEILESENIPEKNRTQVIKELDKLDKIPKSEVARNLKKLNAEKILKIIDSKNFEKYGSYKEIKDLIKLAKSFGVELLFSPTLARGLSYYNGTILEINGKDGVGSIAGGGAYLVNGIQCFGIAFGLERISMLSKIEADTIDYLIISLNQDSRAINLAEKLRSKNKSVQIFFDKTLTKSLEYANDKKIKFTIIIGEKEAKENLYKLKDMKTGKDSLLKEIDILKN